MALALREQLHTVPTLHRVLYTNRAVGPECPPLERAGAEGESSGVLRESLRTQGRGELAVGADSELIPIPLDARHLHLVDGGFAVV